MKRKGDMTGLICKECELPLPDNQNADLCSMCYGDVCHGKDGYYQMYLEDEGYRLSDEEWTRGREG